MARFLVRPPANFRGGLPRKKGQGQQEITVTQTTVKNVTMKRIGGKQKLDLFN